VDDVGGVVDRLREAGWETVGEIVDFEDTFLLCYVRGPEGLIVELAERLDGADLLELHLRVPEVVEEASTVASRPG